ncbi:hypothetical protein [Lapillicoccus sp.]|uniref:hypothetical protein n=1 Tax=Lapillicoccus sp. TaxID=1909287 RepID=UPI003982DF3B
MSGFGPPPGAPGEEPRQRRPTYLPPGGLDHPQAPPHGAAGMPGESFPGALAAPGADAGTTAYQRRPSVSRAASHVLAATAHKPGIISLRPMSTGDLLDAAVKHFRRNPGPVWGLALVVLAIAIVPSLLVSGLALSGSWYSALGLDSLIDATSATTLLTAVGVGLAASLLSGLLAHSVAEATLGRRPQLGELWATARPRLLPLIGLQLLVISALALPVVLLVILVAGLADAPGLLLVVVGVALGLAVVAWSVFVATRTALAAPALVLERLGVRSALRRGWALSAGSFWRVSGTAFVVAALALVVFVVIDLPLNLVGALLRLTADLTPSVDDLVGGLAINLSTVLAASVVIPFVAGASTLLYIDQRMRKEGFDLVLLRAASTRLGGPR